MGLKVWLSVDHSRVSSVGAEGKRSRRLEVPNKRITGRGIYRHPCEDHTTPHPTITVPAYDFDPDDPTGRFVGSVRVCPLCWAIL